MYADAIFFASPAIENAFRRWMRSKVTQEEQGGFLVCARPSKGEHSATGRTIKALGLDNALAIVNVAPVMNLSKTPRRSFTVADWERFSKLGWSLGNLSGARWGYPVWFHTHPTGDATPSPNDWSCAAKFAQSPIRLDIFAVATAGPPFDLRVFKPSDYPTDNKVIEWERLPFLSYREKLFRSAAKQGGLLGPPSSRHP